MPMSRRIPKTILPRSIQSTVQEPAEVQQPVLPPSTTPLPTVNESSVPPSTIQWIAKNVTTTVSAGDPGLIVNGHSNFLDASASKLYIKSDGIYSMQCQGSNCKVNISSLTMNGFTNDKPVVLAEGSEFISITCFLRKGDVITMNATPMTQSQPKFDPNQRSHGHVTYQPYVSKVVTNNIYLTISLL